MKIIVVDDSVTFRDSLNYYLEVVLGHEVIGVVNNGVEFLKLKYIHEADIILMDIEMPRLGGAETAKRALFENPFLKIIAITSHVENVYLADLIRAGFKACVFKNNLHNELENAIFKLSSKKMCFPKNILIADDTKQIITNR